MMPVRVYAGMLVLGMAAPAAAEAAAANDRVQRSVAVNHPAIIVPGGATASARPLPAVRRVLDSRERTLATSRFGTPPPRRLVAGAAQRGYACVNNRRRRGFVAYQPWTRSDSTDAYYYQFIYSLYKQNRARRLISTSTGQRYMSKQFEMCSTGGAHSRGGNRLERVGTSFATTTRRTRIIGFKWGKGVRDGTVSASLGFAVPIRAVTINGTVNVHDQDEFTGAQGPDKASPDAFDPYVRNQVNALWEGSDTFVWQGSTHFEGNVGHGLWEYRQSSRNPAFLIDPSLEYHCGRPRPFGCA
jgi:hypothetical protein